tara:strand:+ start:157 stop:285 length:129 start_codon:yes stop_codon:yes gene_type:complete
MNAQDVLVSYAQAIANEGGQSEAEIILCLEGEYKGEAFQDGL